MGFKLMVVLKLRHFTAAEFGASLPFLAVDLLEKLDEFRDRLGVPVVLSSPNSGGLFRFDGGTSQHAFGRAADLRWPVGIDPRRVFEIAQAVGFQGVGVYSWGIHVDTRPGSRFRSWGRIYETKDEYRDVSAGLVLSLLESGGIS